MKKSFLFLQVLLSMSMIVTGCFQNRKPEAKEAVEEETKAEVAEQTEEKETKAAPVPEVDFSDLPEKLENANFLVRTGKSYASFYLGAEEWIVNSDEYRYKNIKISLSGLYSILDKCSSYNDSKEYKAFYENNYKSTLEKLDIDLNSLQAYGLYLIKNYSNLPYEEISDDYESYYKNVNEPKAVVSEDTWGNEFPNITNMIKGEGYSFYVRDHIIILDNKDVSSWKFSFDKFEMNPLYSSPNTNGYYDIKENCIKHDYSSMKDSVDASQAQQIQKEYTSILNKYGITFEDLEKFANFVLDHYYETSEKISEEMEEEPELLFIPIH